MNEELARAISSIVEGLAVLQKELAKEQAKELAETLKELGGTQIGGPQEVQRFTAQEAADYLGICRESIYNLARANKIEHFKVGGKLIFTRKDLDDWVKKGGCTN